MQIDTFPPSRATSSVLAQASPFFDMLVFSKVKERLGGRVRLIITGGAPLARHVEDFLKVAMCCPVVQGYGLTETCAASFICTPDIHVSRRLPFIIDKGIGFLHGLAAAVAAAQSRARNIALHVCGPMGGASGVRTDQARARLPTAAVASFRNGNKRAVGLAACRAT